MRKDPKLIGADYYKRKVLAYLRREQNKLIGQDERWWVLGKAIKFVLTLDERDAKKAGGLKPKKAK